MPPEAPLISPDGTQISGIFHRDVVKASIFASWDAEPSIRPFLEIHEEGSMIAPPENGAIHMEAVTREMPGLFIAAPSPDALVDHVRRTVPLLVVFNEARRLNEQYALSPEVRTTSQT